MKWKHIFTAAFLGVTLFSNHASANVSYEHIRNATGKLTYNDTTFLIDPMLAEKGRYEGFTDCFNPEIRNPTVELPQSKEAVLKNVDAVIVTHTHLDHWDDEAKARIPKTLPIFAQDEKDAAEIRNAGFRDVRIISDQTRFKNVTLSHIEGTHGTQAMYDDPSTAAALGETMGIVFSAPNEKTTYLVGDTVWSVRVTKTLNNAQPDLIIMNTGYAKALRFNEGIIMGTADVAKAAACLPEADIITVHMDSLNHCTVSRQNMRDFIRQSKLEKKVHIPDDGETLVF